MGFCLAANVVTSQNRIGIGLLAAVTAFSGLLLLFRPSFCIRFPDWVWKSCLLISAMATAMLYWWVLEAPDAIRQSWTNLPPREVILKLHVEKITRAQYLDREGYWYLQGRVVEAISPLNELPLPDLFRTEVFLERGTPRLTENQLLIVRGVFVPPQRSFDGEFVLQRAEILEQHVGSSGFQVGALRRAMMSRMVNALDAGAPEGTAYASYMQSMLTGDKSFLEQPEKNQLRNAGVMHFFAVSGFHLTVVALVCFSLLTLAGISRGHATLGMLLFCGLYVWLTGAPISARRALLMMTVFFASRLVQRKPDALAATVAAAWLLLLFEPMQLFTPGYQLSFVVVAGIISQATRLHAHLTPDEADPYATLNSRLPLWKHGLTGLREFFLGSFAVSWTAFWLSAPIIGCHFGTIPFASVALNTLLVPLFALTMTTGFLSALMGIMGLTAVSHFVNHAAWVLLSVVEWVIGFAANAPVTLACDVHPAVASTAVVLMLGVGLTRDLRLTENRGWFVVIPIISLISVFL